MTDNKLLFAVDREKLFKLGANYLKSKEGSDAISAGELKGEERLFISLLGTHLLNTTMYLPQKTLIKVGEQFEEAFLLSVARSKLIKAKRFITWAQDRFWACQKAWWACLLDTQQLL